MLEVSSSVFAEYKSLKFGILFAECLPLPCTLMSDLQTDQGRVLPTQNPKPKLHHSGGQNDVRAAMPL